MAFLLWGLTGIVFAGYGMYAACSKKDRAIGFWANAKTFPVKDVKAYNRAVGKLFMAFGGVFALLGLPLLCEQNTPYALLSVLGAVIETIAAMAYYALAIEKAHRK